MLARIPAEDHLDLLLAFARVPPTIEAYEVIARAHGLTVGRAEWSSEEFRYFCGRAFALMMLDGVVARLACVSLLDDEPDAEISEAMGVPGTQSCDELRDAFDRLRTALTRRIGAATREKTWTASCIHDEADHEFRCAAWTFEHTLLVLLHDGFGDFHVGETGTVDLLIAPRAAESALPESIHRLIAGPMLDWFSEPRE